MLSVADALSLNVDAYFFLEDLLVESQRLPLDSKLRWPIRMAVAMSNSNWDYDLPKKCIDKVRLI